MKTLFTRKRAPVQGNKLVSIFLPLILGAAVSLGMAPLGWWPVAMVALAAYIWLLHMSGETSPRGGFGTGWWFGFGHFIVGLIWLPTAFGYQAKMPAFLGWVALLLLAGVMAVYLALASWAAKRIAGGKLLPLILALGGSWALAEWLRATLFTGFAWNPLAEIALPMGLAGEARFVGTYGLSAMILLIAGSWVAIATKNWKAAGVALALPLLVGVADLAVGSDAAQPGPRVTLVQPNIGQDNKWAGEEADANFAKLAGLSTPKDAAPRLLLWTESAVPDFLEDGYPPDYYTLSPTSARARIARLLNPDDMVLTGAVKLDFDAQGTLTGARNSIFAMDTQGKLLARYDKAHLVPFGEYVPLRAVLEPLGIARLVPGAIDFVPGPGPRTINIGSFGKVGMLICYEMIFSGHVVDKANRPDFIFSPSNDAWFGGWGAPQHHAQARLRAIEEGLPIARVTPTGISGIIDADGNRVASIAQGQAGRIDAVMPPAHAPTLFARYGNAIPLLLAALLLIAAFALARSRAWR